MFFFCVLNADNGLLCTEYNFVAIELICWNFVNQRLGLDVLWMCLLIWKVSFDNIGSEHQEYMKASCTHMISVNTTLYYHTYLLHDELSFTSINIKDSFQSGYDVTVTLVWIWLLCNFSWIWLLCNFIWIWLLCNLSLDMTFL